MNVRTRTGTVHTGITLGAWTHPACSGTNSHNRLLADTTAPVTCSRCLRMAAPAPKSTSTPKAPKAPHTPTADRVAATDGNRAVIRRDTADGVAWLCQRDGEVVNVYLTRRDALAWLAR